MSQPGALLPLQCRHPIKFTMAYPPRPLVNSNPLLFREACESQLLPATRLERLASDLRQGQIRSSFTVAELYRAGGLASPPLGAYPTPSVLLPRGSTPMFTLSGGTISPPVFNTFNATNAHEAALLHLLNPRRVLSTDSARESVLQLCIQNGISINSNSRVLGQGGVAHGTRRRHEFMDVGFAQASSSHLPQLSHYLAGNKTGDNRSGPSARTVSNQSREAHTSKRQKLATSPVNDSRTSASNGKNTESKTSKEKTKAKQVKPLSSRKKPKRPLSAYNIYFRHERAKMLGIDPPSPSSFEYETERRQRKHRKTHGQIGFAELAKTIAHKWKELDDETRLEYGNLAKEELKHYKIALAEHKAGCNKVSQAADST